MKTPSKSIILPDLMSIRSKFDIKKDVINFEYIDISSKNIHSSINLYNINLHLFYHRETLW